MHKKYLKDFKTGIRISASLMLAGVLLTGAAGCASVKGPLAPAPTMLPGVERRMKTAGYWTARHPAPDKVILDEEQIRALNARIEKEKRLTTDIAAFPLEMNAAVLAGELQKQWRALARQKFYLADGRRALRELFEHLRERMDAPPGRGNIPVRFGLVAHYADQRLLPTDQILTIKRLDIDFDELQNSALDVGTPVAVLHESRDGQWYYVRSPASSGWVRQEFVAICERKDIQEWQDHRPFAVVIAAKADIFLDPQGREYYDYVRMGRTFPLVKEITGGLIKVFVPVRSDNGWLDRKTGYLVPGDVYEGYLDYTPRNIFQQAFKLLNAPYGWGGMYGEQDCSRFLMEVFGTVGFNLPRNSASQIHVLPALAVFDDKALIGDKIKVLSDPALAANTFLYFKGHIMLYLGMVEDEPYAIHATWAYRDGEDGREMARVINKVTVSNLRLGHHSRRGSLISRLKKVMTLNPRRSK